LLEDDADVFIKQLTNDGSALVGDSKASRSDEDRFSGRCAVRVTPQQCFTSRMKGWSYPIVEKPQPGQYRYIRFAWKKDGGNGIMMQLCGINDPSTWGHRYVAGQNVVNWQPALVFTPNVPAKWELVTRDLFKDFGGFTLTGIALTPMDGTAGFYDHIYLGDSVANLDTVTDAALGKTPVKDKPTAEQLSKCWEDLASRDAVVSAPAQRLLFAADKETVELLTKRLKGREATDEEKNILKLIADLDDDDFGVRENASTDLVKVGEKAEPFLKKALAEAGSLEVRRRVEALLGNRAADDDISVDQLQQIRAVHALEQIGTTPAREALEVLAKEKLPLAVSGEVKVVLKRWKK
jgi:hypothetical protein